MSCFSLNSAKHFLIEHILANRFKFWALVKPVTVNINIFWEASKSAGGAVASRLVRSTPERAVWVRALAGVIVLCSWARHFIDTVPLSTQVSKWVPANC